jgi:hypothetical protein
MFIGRKMIQNSYKVVIKIDSEPVLCGSFVYNVCHDGFQKRFETSLKLFFFFF